MTKPKMIPIATWAASRYDPVPSNWVLRRWCRDGEIYPPPERVGKEWRVLERINAAWEACRYYPEHASDH